MKSCIAIVAVLLISRPCISRTVVESEESVVSVYTTLPTTAGTTAPLDVYHQIANNIAERITSPIYRFLGINRNKTEEKATVTSNKPWDKIEILDEPEDVTKPDLPPIENDLTLPRDVEEISLEVAKRVDKKPEKLTLFSSFLTENKPERISLFSRYLPVKGQDANDTGIDDGFFDFGNDDDDDDDEKPRQGGPLIYIIEFLAGAIQLLWGGFMNLFKPAESESS